MRLGLWSGKRRSIVLVFLALAIGSFGTLPAYAQSRADWAALNDRLNGLEERLGAMRQGRGTLPQDRVRSNIPPSSSAALSLRLSNLEGQIRRLTGQVESMSFQMRKLEDQLKRFSKDSELRFRDLERGKPRSQRRSQVPTRRPREQITQRPLRTEPRVRSRDPLVVSRDPLVASRPFTLPDARTIRRFGPSMPGQRPPPIVAPGRNSSLLKAAPPSSLGRIPANSLPPGDSVATLPPSNDLNQPRVDEAGSIYERGYENYLRRRFQSAESSFRGFLRRFPRHELAGQAHYWLGESFYARGKFRDAARSFLIGYRKFPKNRRAPESLLKLGMSLRKLGDKAQACATLTKLRKQYPRASSGIKKTAASERRRAGC